jgi:hypothetical protein
MIMNGYEQVRNPEEISCGLFYATFHKETGKTTSNLSGKLTSRMSFCRANATALTSISYSCFLQRKVRCLNVTMESKKNTACLPKHYVWLSWSSLKLHVFLIQVLATDVFSWKQRMTLPLEMRWARHVMCMVNACKILVAKPEGRLEDGDVVGKIVLKWILGKSYGKLWMGFL